MTSYNENVLPEQASRLGYLYSARHSRMQPLDRYISTGSGEMAPVLLLRNVDRRIPSVLVITN